MGSKDDKSGGSGLGMDDFRLWKEFTRDIDPLDDPDWEALEALIAHQSPHTKILKEHTPEPTPNTQVFTPKRPSLPQTPQLDGNTENRLRRGKMPIEGRLDLHGYYQEEAHRRLTNFILDAQARGKRCLLVITGKGGDKSAIPWNGEREEGVLKQRVPQWLSVPPLREAVLKTSPAQPHHGGSGAMYVYLRRAREPVL